MKKDDFLSDIIQVPPKQRIPIAPFDLRTQRDAFSVSLEGLKGVRPPLSLLRLVPLTHPMPVEHPCACPRVHAGPRR